MFLKGPISSRSPPAVISSKYGLCRGVFEGATATGWRGHPGDGRAPETICQWGSWKIGLANTPSPHQKKHIWWFPCSFPLKPLPKKGTLKEAQPPHFAERAGAGQDFRTEAQHLPGASNFGPDAKEHHRPRTTRKCWSTHEDYFIFTRISSPFSFLFFFGGGGPLFSTHQANKMIFCWS